MNKIEGESARAVYKSLLYLRAGERGSIFTRSFARGSGLQRRKLVVEGRE